MTNSPAIDIYCPNWSKGLSVSAGVLKDMIRHVSGDRVGARIFWLPENFYAGDRRNDPPHPRLAERGSVAIFVERLFVRPWLDGYGARLFLHNPEWLTADAADLADGMIDLFLHKSNFSLDKLGARFARARHCRIGFTSPDPGVTVGGHDQFSHFRGKATTRFTQVLLDIWRRRPDLPPLWVQAYGRDIAVRLPEWLNAGNINLLLNYHDSNERYFADLARGGIHLCTSSVEAFGHYINESRAMSALVLTLDAPPMNELITAETGILIPTTGVAPMNLGERYDTSEAHIEQAIEHALGMSAADKLSIGQAARRAFEAGRRDFAERIEYLLRNELAWAV